MTTMKLRPLFSLMNRTTNQLMATSLSRSPSLSLICMLGCKRRLMSSSAGVTNSNQSSSPPTPQSSSSSITEDNRRLANKTVLVTGSTYGIGHSIARRCYQDGANVIICSRSEKNVAKALDDIRATVNNDGRSNEIHGIPCHVGNEFERQRLVDFTLEKFGRIDGFVSNAAVNPHVGPIDEVSESQLDKLYEVNYKSHLILTQKLLPHMKKVAKEAPTGCGPSIIFISTAAAFIGIPNIGAYSVSKACLLTLTKVLAQENGKHNIRVNCIAPGVMNTSFAQVLMRRREIFDHFLNNLLGRPGHPHEIDGCASFLLSNDASYVTNELICVSGGVMARY